MIDNPISIVRALKGCPLSCLFALAITNQPTGEDLLVSVTGYSDKTVNSALKTLKEFGLAVSTSRTHGWQLTGDARQLPLSQDLLESASRNSEIPHVVGVVVNLNNSLDSIKQQQQQRAGNSDSDFSEEQARVYKTLLKTGLWPNISRGLVDSDIRDVLGWIAYCCDPQNKIHNKPALIAAQLRGGENHPGDRYMPQFVCGACHLSENKCSCENPTLIIPDEFLEKAFEEPPSWGREAWLVSRWCCESCGGCPCQCDTGNGDSEDENSASV